jgi:hypothetical protein
MTADPARLYVYMARQDIGDVLARYCRGVDRCDLETLQGVFWPEATAQYGATIQNAWEWAAQLLPRLAQMLRTQHAISNSIIDVDGDRATAETYCRAYHEIETPEGRREMMVGGRYLDRLERRGGVWKIAARVYVMDWNQNTPSTAQWDGPMYGRLSTTGQRHPHDPLYSFPGS